MLQCNCACFLELVEIQSLVSHIKESLIPETAVQCSGTPGRHTNILPADKKCISWKKSTDMTAMDTLNCLDESTWNSFSKDNNAPFLTRKIL